jgi:hypothetical protein
MHRILVLFVTVFVIQQIYSQEPLIHKKKTYIDPDGKLYIQRELPLYVWLSTDPGKESKKYKLWSTETSRYSNPMYLDTEGYNTFRSPSAVDTATHKTIYPLRDIVFEVYADGIAPKTKIDYGEAILYKSGEILYLGASAEVTLTATDANSGVEDIYVSIDGSVFKPYTGPILINEEKEYKIKYYAVDNVGNVENVFEKNLLYDKTAPVTKHEILGDFHEDILSGRSKIALLSEDKGTGINTIYYSINDGPEKVYKTPILAAYLAQDDHTIKYYAKDQVGNQESIKTYNFYVDKTPPTIIEEVMGKSFFSGGKEYSSGKSRLKLTSFDNKAGVKEVRYSVNSGEYELYDKPVFLTQSSGNILIKSYAVDYVNNRSNSQTANEKTSIPYIDLTGPELNHVFIGPKFTTRDTTFINYETKIILKGNDSEAGLNRIEYSLNGSNPMEYTEAFLVEKEGYSVVDYTGFDNVDNTSGKSFGFKVDNSGPEISEAFGTTSLRTENGLKVYPAHVILFLIATDKVVGLQRITYSINNGSINEYVGLIKNLPKGKITINVIAYDKLGNSSDYKTEFTIE